MHEPSACDRDGVVTDQGSLFDGGLSDPGEDRPGLHQRPGDAAETQRRSAYEVMPATGTWRRRVLRAIWQRGEDGATDDELQVLLDLNPSTERPRRVELVDGGWIEDSSRRRRTRSGHSAVVWTLTPTAWERLRGRAR